VRQHSRKGVLPMKLSRTVSYAVEAVLQLAQLDPATPVPCSRLAAAGNMPERFLLQILRTLVTKGILRSTRGVDGGYALARAADKISLLELIEAIEGKLEPNAAASEALPAESRRKLQAVLSDIMSATREQLAAITISQLLPDERK
jgi:Rrf2 family protein